MHTHRGKFQNRAGNDPYDDPDDDADGLGMGWLDMGAGEERPHEGNASVYTYCHDEKDAHIQVAGEEEPLDFAHGIAEHPVFPPCIVDDQQWQRQNIQKITDCQVARQDDASVPVPSFSDHQQPQSKQVSCQSQDEL